MTILLRKTYYALLSMGFNPVTPRMALLNMHDKITNAMDNNEYSVGVFFDISKAFDTVNHDILLQKLYHYGIRGMQFHWFKSYLTERSQYVCCKEASSSIKTFGMASLRTPS